jgi:hypothetical protein
VEIALLAPRRLCYNATHLGEWPSGKAAAFGAAIRRFESCLPSLSSTATARHDPVAVFRRCARENDFDGQEVLLFT